MRVLIFGDVYGRVGRKALAAEIPRLREQYAPDGIIANIENATSGRGPVSEHAQLFTDMGIDAMTLGDHAFDNRDNISSYLDAPNTNLIRPANFYQQDTYPLPGKGYIIIEIGTVRVLLIQVLGEAFMRHNVVNPFLTVEKILAEVGEENYDVSVVDFHRETTAEIAAMGHFLDGKASVVYGTHTHVQTSDARILPEGTAYISDVGMNGPFNSIIGAEFSSVKPRFLSGVQQGKISQQTAGSYQINALIVDIDETTKKTTHIEAISYVKNL